MPAMLADFVIISLLIQSGAAIGIEQIPANKASPTALRVAPIDANRSSATEQAPIPDKVPGPLTPAQVAICAEARAKNRPAPKGLDCVQAPVAAPRREAAPTAEISLLNMFGGNLNTGATPAGNVDPASADSVARQLSNGELQSDTAASIARDRTPPPSQQPPPSR